MPIRPFYDRWPQYNRRLIGAVRDLDDEQLAIPADLQDWPIWAVLAHTAAGRRQPTLTLSARRPRYDAVDAAENAQAQRPSSEPRDARPSAPARQAAP